VSETVYSAEVPYRGTYRLQRLRFGRGAPHLAVVAGQHGNELTAVYAVNLLASALRAQAPHGTVDLVPLANTFGVDEGRKLGPFDDQDLNQSFPGRADGTAMERVAHALLEATQAEVCVDVHAGSPLMEELPQVRMPLEGPETELGRAMGLPLVWRRPTRSQDGVELVGAWRLRGARALRVTGGQGATLDKQVGLEIANGIRRLMAHMGMSAAPRPGQLLGDVSDEDVHVLRCEAGGMFVPEVTVGERVSPGYLLGRIVAPVGGATIEEIRATHAGVVMSLRRYPMAHAQELLLRIACL
jgi:predicted deacylase